MFPGESTEAREGGPTADTAQEAESSLLSHTENVSRKWGGTMGTQSPSRRRASPSKAPQPPQQRHPLGPIVPIPPPAGTFSLRPTCTRQASKVTGRRAPELLLLRVLPLHQCLLTSGTGTQERTLSSI